MKEKRYIIACTDIAGRPAVFAGFEAIVEPEFVGDKVQPKKTGNDRAITLPVSAINTSIFERPWFFATPEIAYDFVRKIQQDPHTDTSGLTYIHIFPIHECVNCGQLTVDPKDQMAEPFVCEKCLVKSRRRDGKSKTTSAPASKRKTQKKAV